MLFNTTEFLLFFIIVLALYWIIPSKFRYLWLLAASYFFYMQWNKKYIILLLFITIITYLGGILIEKIPNAMHKKRLLVMVVCIVICLSLLGIFKYLNFMINGIDFVLSRFNKPIIPLFENIILPVGISFYTLQSLGYIIDVYRKDIYAEKNFFRFALFVSFFPQLVAGPIERSKNLLKQLSCPQRFSYDNFRKGFILILYGLFLKMVIADRAAIFVDAVYNDYQTYHGYFIVIATILFSIQIYCDFYGYSTIARGAALTMGITLVENFNAPYYSKSIKEFWRRWHISLSTWFRDYLYIPLGGNRKGKLRKNINLMIVFSISGLWHGATLSFVFWGMIHGIYQLISDIFYPVKNKTCQIIKYIEHVPEQIFKTVVTFVLTTFAWLFFRAGGFREACNILRNMIFDRSGAVFFDDSIYMLGIDRKYFGVLLLSIAILLIVDYMKYNNVDVISAYFNQNIWFRCMATVGLIFIIMLFGVYGELYDAQSFIYFQF